MRNKMTWYFLLHVSICTAIYYILGWSSLRYQFFYTLQGICYQETVNYIEHYGLVRKKDENGVYESISKMHSWNQVSSTVMFRI
jgi:alkane 1-monooxygenase